MSDYLYLPLRFYSSDNLIPADASEITPHNIEIPLPPTTYQGLLNHYQTHQSEGDNFHAGFGAMLIPRISTNFNNPHLPNEWRKAFDTLFDLSGAVRDWQIMFGTNIALRYHRRTEPMFVTTAFHRPSRCYRTIMLANPAELPLLDRQTFETLITDGVPNQFPRENRTTLIAQLHLACHDWHIAYTGRDTPYPTSATEPPTPVRCEYVGTDDLYLAAKVIIPVDKIDTNNINSAEICDALAKFTEAYLNARQTGE